MPSTTTNHYVDQWVQDKNLHVQVKVYMAGRNVAQVSQPAVSRIPNPQIADSPVARDLTRFAEWNSATQQVGETCATLHAKAVANNT
jgi:hypothetical protein